MIQVAVKDIKLNEITRFIVGDTNTKNIHIKNHEVLAAEVREVNKQGQDLYFVTHDRKKGIVVLDG